jgi:hypothetical protein
MFEMGLNGLLKEMEEGDKGEAILSCRGFVALIEVWPRAQQKSKKEGFPYPYDLQRILENELFISYA